MARESELVLLHDRCDCLWDADARVAGKSSSRLCDRDGPGKLTLHETRLEGRGRSDARHCDLYACAVEVCLPLRSACVRHHFSHGHASTVCVDGGMLGTMWVSANQLVQLCSLTLMSGLLMRVPTLYLKREAIQRHRRRVVTHRCYYRVTSLA